MLCNFSINMESDFCEFFRLTGTRTGFNRAISFRRSEQRAKFGGEKKTMSLWDTWEFTLDNSDRQE